MRADHLCRHPESIVTKEAVFAMTCIREASEPKLELEVSASHQPDAEASARSDKLIPRRKRRFRIPSYLPTNEGN